MASFESSVLKFWLKRQNIFGSGKYTPATLRKRMSQATARLAPHPSVKLKLMHIGKLRGEWLIPPKAPDDCVMLYFHGGGWLMGSARSYRSLVSHLAFNSGIRALSINFRLAPEHPYPEGLEDCIAAYQWLLDNGFPPHKIVLVGDSSGANLALAVMLAAKASGTPLPAGCVALSPITDLTLSGDTVRTHYHRDPILSTIRSRRLIADYVTDHDPRDPLISPLYGDLHGLPPLLIHVGDRELLLDDARQFGKKAQEAGVKVELVVWPQMFHNFQMFVELMPEARQAVGQVARFIRARVETVPQNLENQ